MWPWSEAGPEAVDKGLGQQWLVSPLPCTSLWSETQFCSEQVVTTRKTLIGTGAAFFPISSDPSAPATTGSKLGYPLLTALEIQAAKSGVDFSVILVISKRLWWLLIT